MTARRVRIARINPGERPVGRGRGRPPIPPAPPEIPAQLCPAEGLTWYIAVAKPGQAWKATERLRTELGIAAWCPLGLVERTPSRRTLQVWQPLLAPYLFAGLRPEQGVAMVRECIGMAGLSCSDGGVPQTIAVEVLARLWQRCEDSDPPGALSLLPVQRGPWAATLKEGELLLVNSGPFMGYSGIFSHLEGNIIKMWIDILGRRTLFSAAANQVIRAK